MTDRLQWNSKVSCNASWCGYHSILYYWKDVAEQLSCILSNVCPGKFLNRKSLFWFDCKCKFKIWFFTNTADYPEDSSKTYHIQAIVQ